MTVSKNPLSWRLPCTTNMHTDETLLVAALTRLEVIMGVDTTTRPELGTMTDKSKQEQPVALWCSNPILSAVHAVGGQIKGRHTLLPLSMKWT